MAGSGWYSTPSLDVSTTNSAGPSSVAAATSISSALDASGTSAFSPSIVQPPPVARAVVFGANGSNSAPRSSTATAAGAGASPVNAGR